MDYVFLITFIVAGLLSLGLIALIYFNVKAIKQKERTDRLNYSTAAYFCMLAVFAYTIYWIMQQDLLRMIAYVILMVHMILLFVMVFVSSKHASKSENLPSVIKSSLVTFVILHLAMPAFPEIGNQERLYIIFKLFDDEVIATVGLMTSMFLLFINFILMIAQFVMFMKVRKD